MKQATCYVCWKLCWILYAESPCKVSPRTVVQLYMLIAISVKGKSVIWKSPEVWARGRLCAQSPRSRRGKQLAAWGLGPCSARKGETAEGPWSHQLSSHTPDFFIVFYFYHSFLFFILIPSIVSPNTCILLFKRRGVLQLFKMHLASEITWDSKMDTLEGEKQEHLQH